MPEANLVAFAERVLALLDQGSFVATYKYAVLLGLMDLCLEGTRRDGTAPDSVTTRQLAEKVIELYWPQTTEFRGKSLRQNSGSQARILTDISAFRASLDDPTGAMDRARRDAPPRFERLVRKVEWTLVLMPLPRLQVVGGEKERLLYNIGWGFEIERNRRAVTEYQRSRTGSFDNRILLLPGVGDYLVALNALLRPLIHRAWSAMVADLNGLHESKLEAFLFGIDRSALAPVRGGLLDMQQGLCFYCDAPVGRNGHVDHFIPWARYPDNGIENLVVADERCNGAKRDFMAAHQHVVRWRTRNTSRNKDLTQLADGLRWETHPDDTLGVARGIYFRLPPQARLWLRGQEFCTASTADFRGSLTD